MSPATCSMGEAVGEDQQPLPKPLMFGQEICKDLCGNKDFNMEADHICAKFESQLSASRNTVNRQRHSLLQRIPLLSPKAPQVSASHF